MSEQNSDKLLPLTPLTLHVMLALADVERHGYGIIKEVSFRTSGRVELETGTLYAALKRMRDDELIEVVPASERPPEEDSRRRTYRLTAFGREVLRAETERLKDLVGTAIAKQVIPAAALGDGK
jgi:DNA-binding PadR family transcriptional regulator